MVCVRKFVDRITLSLKRSWLATSWSDQEKMRLTSSSSSCPFLFFLAPPFLFIFATQQTRGVMRRFTVIGHF